LVGAYKLDSVPSYVNSLATIIYLSDIPACYKKQGPETCLFCLAPDGVFPRNTLLYSGVRSYRTFSPLPARTWHWRFFLCGTFHELLAPLICIDCLRYQSYEASFLLGVQTFLPPTAMVEERLPSIFQRTTYPTHRLINICPIVTGKEEFTPIIAP
jgi:hypothetical protein